MPQSNPVSALDFLNKVAARTKEGPYDKDLCANPKCQHERGQHWDDVCHVDGCLCAHWRTADTSALKP